MQFQVLSIILAASALVSGARIEARGKYGGYGGGKKAAVAVCPSNTTPLCCQLDVLGVVDASCVGAGPQKSVKAFDAYCAGTGLTAECCTLAVGGIGLLCEEP